MRIKSIAFFLFTVLCFYAKAQNPAVELANRIAQKMKDTLTLDDSQKSAVYVVNMQLHNQKAGIWSRYAGNTDSIRYYIQRIENTRDSSYETVLPPEKYQLYEEKKKNLVTAN